MREIFVECDAPTGRKCKYHCSPSCHPLQVGPEWVYGCLDKEWPHNQNGDFCPIVECGGDIDKCERPSAVKWRSGATMRGAKK